MITSAPCATDALRIAGDVLAVIIGDETGSRFYWELVDPGRVDSIDMTYHEYEGAGAFIISAACEPASADENLTRLFGILEDVMRRGVTADELSQAKSKLKARVVLAAERPRNRLFPVGYNWIYRGEYRSLEKDLADLEAVTLDDIRQLLDQHQIQQTTTVCLGPLESLKSLGISADGCALNGSSRRAGAKDK